MALYKKKTKKKNRKNRKPFKGPFPADKDLNLKLAESSISTSEAEPTETGINSSIGTKDNNRSTKENSDPEILKHPTIDSKLKHDRTEDSIVDSEKKGIQEQSNNNKELRRPPIKNRFGKKIWKILRENAFIAALSVSFLFLLITFLINYYTDMGVLKEKSKDIKEDVKKNENNIDVIKDDINKINININSINKDNKFIHYKIDKDIKKRSQR